MEWSGIDLDFRPKSYFWPPGLETHLLSRIKGAERKFALKRLIDSGRLDDIPEFLKQSALSDAEREALGRVHPAFMGGEYLPILSDDQAIIARITIASTTQDVTCVYARLGEGCLHYRVVDEYGGDTLSELTTLTSPGPLTLGELESFFNGAWDLFSVLEMNFEVAGDDDSEEQRFVVEVSSAFYPDLERLYRLRIREWVDRRRRVEPPSRFTRTE